MSQSMEGIIRYTVNKDDLAAMIGNTIRHELKPLQQQLDKIETTVAALDTRVATLETRVATLDTRVATLETRVATLETSVNSVLATFGDTTLSLKHLKASQRNEVIRRKNMAVIFNPRTQLQCLYSVLSGDPIQNFPGTLQELATLDVDTLEAILLELGLPKHGDEFDMREAIRTAAIAP